MNLKIWLSAFRLRTLPLAMASIFMGSFLAAHYGQFRLDVFLLTVLVAILLQILSNLANDYGDSKHGADHAGRKGPSRTVQSGQITNSAMKKAILAFIVLCLISGITLLWVAFGFGVRFFFFLALGLLAIAAAIAYTNGKKPYGYAGLGDISVLIFFGLTGVLGSLFLHVLTIRAIDFLPALSTGFFATAVLNVNNIRDIESDRIAGKYTIPVRLGRSAAVWYHWLLLTFGFSTAAIYAFFEFEYWHQYIFLITLPLFIKNAQAVKTIKDAQKLDPYLRQMAISSLLFVVAFGLGLLM